MINIQQWEAYFAHRDALIAAEINAIKQVETQHETASNAAEAATDAEIAALDTEYDNTIDHVFALREKESTAVQKGGYDTFFEKYRGWIRAIQADAVTRRSAIYAAAKATRNALWERKLANIKAIEAEYQEKAKGLTFETFTKK